MTSTDRTLAAIAENVDALITLDLTRTSVRELHQASRQYHGMSPSLLAAQRLAQAVRPADVVVLVTGALGAPFGTGETDGPIGTAALARALSLVMKARPLVLTMPSMIDMVAATLRAATLNVISPSHLGEVDESMRGFVAVGSFPIEDSVAQSEARRLIDEFAPRTVIAVEVTGPNDKGVYHNYGRDFSPHIMKAGRLFEVAKDRDILTIGVGDRGNEIGFGAPELNKAARRTHPYGTTCRCPCGVGAADVTPVDVTVVATVSNWGAYGIEAALSAVLRSREAMHDGTIERRMLDACSRSGGVDGLSQTPEYLVDGLSEGIQVGIVEMLRAIVAARVDFVPAAFHDPFGKGKY